MTMRASSVTTKVKRATFAVVRRAPLAPLTRLPASGGPAIQKAVLVQADYLRKTSRPQAAVDLLNAVPRSELSSNGLRLLTQCYESTGELHQALATARLATDVPEPGASAVLARLRIARALEDSHEERLALAAALKAQPQSASEAERLARGFRSEDPEVLSIFIEHSRAWEFPVPEEVRLRLEADLMVAHGASTEDLVRRAMDEAAESPEGRDRAVRRIASTGDWSALAEVVHDHTIREDVAKDLSRYAQRALKAGRLSEAATMSECAIRSGSGMNTARSVHVQALDQIQVVRSGWPVEAHRVPEYEVDRSSTLSVLAQSLPHRSGGYATRSHGILTGLKHLGWDPQAVTRLGFPYDRWPARSTDEVADLDVVDGIAYHRLLEPGERIYGTTPMASYIERFTQRIMGQARSQRAALIHASSFQNNGLAGLAAARRLGVPFIYEMRGLEDLMKCARNPRFAETASYDYMTSLENHIVAQADLTFVITHALREEMIRRGGPADRIEVLPNGVHTSDFEPRERDASLLAELNLTGRKIIGYAGGLVDYEGLDLLVEAADILSQQRSDFAVVVVGDGHMEGRLRRMVQERGLGDLVLFTGRVPHAEIPRYLSIFDVTPFPRLPLEVCELISPIKPFEAMAMGKAVIASSVAALTEIVEPDVRGLIFEKGNSADLAQQLTRYLDSPELQRTMGEAAREWVLAEQDWSDVVTVADAAYHRLINRSA
ncbi:MAG: glycosyltransferase family 4 protein, partial [Ornithinimicrobium sp.]